jgi:Luciferase-like monooxygenase
MKRIGFLTFGHWRAAPGSQTRSAADALLQTVELAEAAEKIGIDGAFVRLHHFERQLSSPFPLLSAIAARTRRIQIGTAVILPSPGRLGRPLLPAACLAVCRISRLAGALAEGLCLVEGERGGHGRGALIVDGKPERPGGRKCVRPLQRRAVQERH